MKFMLLIGDGAVGKMTVGQHLMKSTGLKLFHDHMMLETVLQIFDRYDSEVIQRLRMVVFDEFARSEHPGMIYTFQWAFENQDDWDYVNSIFEIFHPYCKDFYIVELVAPLDVRIERNKTENRLKHKPSKRNLKFSERLLVWDDKLYRTVSLPNELPFENYLRIDNSDLSADDCAKLIQTRFNL